MKLAILGLIMVNLVGCANSGANSFNTNNLSQPQITILDNGVKLPPHVDPDNLKGLKVDE